MLTSSFSPRVALLSVAAAALVLSSACSKQDRDTASTKAKDTYADVKASMEHAWDEVKSFSFDQRDKFAANAKALQANMEAQTSRLQADYSDAQASASRKAAMAELKSADADYKQKVEALGDASAATWDSAKQNTIAAWDRLEAAYYKARAD